MIPTFQRQAHKYLTGRILDVGYVTKPLEMEGELYGVDIQTAPCPHGYRDVKVANLNIEPIPYPDGFFDSVFAGETIEHVTNPVRLLVECNRVLKPGGRCVMTTPNPFYWLEIVHNAFVNRFHDSENDQHLNSPTRFVMRACAKRAGFDLEWEEGTFCHIPVIRKKIILPRWPMLTSQIIYVMRKTREFDQHSIAVSRPHERFDLPKQFEIDAKLF